MFFDIVHLINIERVHERLEFLNILFNLLYLGLISWQNVVASMKEMHALCIQFQLIDIIHHVCVVEDNRSN